MGALFYLQNVTVLHQATTRWRRGKGQESLLRATAKGQKQLNFWPNPQPASWIHRGRLLAFAAGRARLPALGGGCLIVGLGPRALRTLGDRGPTLFPPAGGGRGQAHESLYQHDREEALQHLALREQPRQLQVKAGLSPRELSTCTRHPPPRPRRLPRLQSELRPPGTFQKPLVGGKCLGGPFALSIPAIGYSAVPP